MGAAVFVGNPSIEARNPLFIHISTYKKIHVYIHIDMFTHTTLEPTIQIVLGLLGLHAEVYVSYDTRQLWPLRPKLRDLAKQLVLWPRVGNGQHLNDVGSLYQGRYIKFATHMCCLGRDDID